MLEIACKPIGETLKNTNTITSRSLAIGIHGAITDKAFIKEFLGYVRYNFKETSLEFHSDTSSYVTAIPRYHELATFFYPSRLFIER